MNTLINDQAEQLLDLMFYIVSTNHAITIEDIKEKYKVELAHFMVDDVNLLNILQTLVKRNLVLSDNGHYRVNLIGGDFVSHIKQKIDKRKNRIQRGFFDLLFKLAPIIISIVFGVLACNDNVQVNKLTNEVESLAVKVETLNDSINIKKRNRETAVEPQALRDSVNNQNRTVATHGKDTMCKKCGKDIKIR